MKTTTTGKLTAYIENTGININFNKLDIYDGLIVLWYNGKIVSALLSEYYTITEDNTKSFYTISYK